ncbi:hypothetical protein H0H92_003308 [Tricholoma furcatifolium]|nr:hypothetical protein H0H92_003308 [Tricholoma furcatifolium]
MANTCIFCSRSFNERKGLSVHVKKCSKKINTLRITDIAGEDERRRPFNDKSKIQLQDFIPSMNQSGDALPNSVQEPNEIDTVNPSTSSHHLPVPPGTSEIIPLVDHLPAEPSGLRRSTRRHALPKRYRVSPEPEAEPPRSKKQRLLVPDSPPPIQIEYEPIETEPDAMGLFRCYSGPLPSHDPDQHLTIHHVADAPTFIKQGNSPEAHPLNGFGPQATEIAAEEQTSPFAPFLNATVFRLMNWFYQSTTKTLADLDSLVNDVILHPDFTQSDLRGFRAARECQRLEEMGTKTSSSLPYFKTDNWKESTVKLHLPLVREKFICENQAPALEVKFVHRSFMEVLKTGIQEYAASSAHLRGFKQFWKPSPTEPAQRVYGEVYTSDAFLQMEEELPDIPGCNLEKVVAPLLLYSDSTHLANFGTASLWPIYIWFGWISKYSRARTSSFAAHHLAYLPSLPNSIQDLYMELFNQAAPDSSIKHLKRDLFQKIWELLLSCEDFREAYHKGLVMKCSDGIWRRFFPRFWAYLADYVERMDSAAEQFNVEVARSKIYQSGFVADGKPIDRILNDSKTPIRNAFSNFLLPHSVNFYDLFVVDVLHEIELGVFKSIFTHLIRILYTMGSRGVADLDRRFRKVPTFGRSTIRRFSNNVSEMKKLAGRDFEDILQCAGPCFEGLFPRKTDRHIQDFLFIIACWHASAKLRLHTDSTLDVFRGLTQSFTRAIRHFSLKICPQFDTIQTPSEYAATMRAKAAKTKKETGPGKEKPVATQGTRRAPRSFNTDTPKFHSIVHYPNAIAMYGTTDSYSTHLGEREHRRVKRFFSRTNKNRFEKQIGRHERRHARLRAIHSRASQTADNPRNHHHISESKAVPLNIFTWIQRLENDAAGDQLYNKLSNHLLQRLLLDGLQVEPADLSKLVILDSQIYIHKALRVNFTTYDNRRDQDTINPRLHSDIMLLTNNSDHPYGYARVIGIFHAIVCFNSSRSKQQGLHRIEFLWVRWYDIDGKARAGFRARRQFQVKFRKGSQAFGFMDPSNVLRAAHLIPNFDRGRTDRYLGPSVARREDEMDRDYERFVDRDMFMRYLGGGIGHVASRHLTRGFEEEAKDIWASTSTDAPSDSDSDADPGVENDQATEEDPYASTNVREDEEELDSDSESDLEENEQAEDGDYDGHFDETL